MGVNLYMEDEDGAQLAEVGDPKGFVERIVSIAGNEKTVCLRFIDLYGDTVFNQLQIPVLVRELEAARGQLTERRFAQLGQHALKSARKAKEAPAVIQHIESANRIRSASNVRAHLERILKLARRAQGEVHTYLKFYGD